MKPYNDLIAIMRKLAKGEFSKDILQINEQLCVCKKI